MILNIPVFELQAVDCQEEVQKVNEQVHQRLEPRPRDISPIHTKMFTLGICLNCVEINDDKIWMMLFFWPAK